MLNLSLPAKVASFVAATTLTTEQRSLFQNLDSSDIREFESLYAGIEDGKRNFNRAVIDLGRRLFDMQNWFSRIVGLKQGKTLFYEFSRTSLGLGRSATDMYLSAYEGFGDERTDLVSGFGVALMAFCAQAKLTDDQIRDVGVRVQGNEAQSRILEELRKARGVASSQEVLDMEDLLLEMPMTSPAAASADALQKLQELVDAERTRTQDAERKRAELEDALMSRGLELQSQNSTVEDLRAKISELESRKTPSSDDSSRLRETQARVQQEEQKLHGLRSEMSNLEAKKQLVLSEQSGDDNLAKEVAVMADQCRQMLGAVAVISAQIAICPPNSPHRKTAVQLGQLVVEIGNALLLQNPKG